MKKILNYVLIAAAFIMLASCSGGSNYSAEKCKALADKISSHQEITDGDYSEMIDQLQAIVDILKDKEKEIGDSEEKKNEFANSEEAKEYIGYFLGFAMYLDMHSDKLSDANKQKLDKIKNEFEKESAND